jgi:hypothetical protein
MNSSPESLLLKHIIYAKLHHASGVPDLNSVHIKYIRNAHGSETVFTHVFDDYIKALVTGVLQQM